MIEYVKGDATLPQGEGIKIVVHIVNDLGLFGSGFAKCVAEKYPIVREKYREWALTGTNFGLGSTQVVKITDTLYFINLIGQRGVRAVGDTKSPAPIKYFAVKRGLKDAWLWAKDMSATIHMPRIGCGLAGGKWEEIEKIVNEELIANNIKVVVYDL